MPLVPFKLWDGNDIEFHQQAQIQTVYKVYVLKKNTSDLYMLLYGIAMMYYNKDAKRLCILLNIVYIYCFSIEIFFQFRAMKFLLVH